MIKIHSEGEFPRFYRDEKLGSSSRSALLLLFAASISGILVGGKHVVVQNVDLG